jgi:cytochrome c-type protein NapC
MSDLEKQDDKKGLFVWFRKTTIAGASLVVVLSATVFGLVLAGGFNTIISATNTESFCTSCHEMEINYDEYQETVHYKNRTGVRATCPDCHVPKEFGPKMFAKLMAAKDVWHHLLGTIDTKEKYEAYRLTMAESVWKKMKDTDSRECRTCHDANSMDFEEQQGRAARKHKNMEEKGKTCIDCHKGVAHELPEDYEEE